MAVKGGGLKAFWIVGVAVALLLAGFVSFYASSQPDGLEKVAAERGFDKGAKDHDFADSPFADYQTGNVRNTRLSGGLAGVLGVGATLMVGTAVFWVVRRGSAATPSRG